VAGVTTHQIPLLLHNGVPAGTAAAMVSVYAVCWTLGGVIWGFVAERVLGRYALALIYIAGAVATLVLLRADGAGPAVVFALIYGLTIGGSSTLEAVIWADYYGRTAIGSIRGFARPFLMAANALGPLSAGIAVDALGSYELPYLGFAAITLVAAVLMLLALPPQRTYPPRPTPDAGRG
jgi:MFS family permease